MARLDLNEVRTGEAERLLLELGQAVHQLRLEVGDLAGVGADVRQAVGEAAATTSAGIGRLRTETTSLAWRLADLDIPASPDHGPLVSIIVPTWQRAGILRQALDSVLAQTYTRWACTVVDDGSTDGTYGVVAGYLDDPRFRYEPGDHLGAPAARNRGLALAEGDVVAYLDSDNVWHRSHLARVVDAFERRPDAAWVLTGQILVDDDAYEASLRSDLWSIDSLRRRNFVDLNAVAHRRSALDRIGPFDEARLRLSDWDLVLRLCTITPPVHIPAATILYRTASANRISDTVPPHVHAHAIRQRHRGDPAAGLRILLAEWHFPQITETYIAAAVQGLSSLGAEVRVWSEGPVAVAYPSPVPVLRGELDEALVAYAPDIVLSHWLSKGHHFRPATAAAGIPHAVRVHGFEYDPRAVAALLEDPGVIVHTFPHLVDAAWARHPRLVISHTCFDDTRYRPTTDKDPRLVVRTAAGLLTKDLDSFLVAARLCPEHRFVLVLGHALLVEEATEQVVERAAELESPCEILVDVGHAEVADLVSEAGIYLHTHGTEHPVSMPISIAESMATGCWVLGRDLPGMAAYLGEAGSLYGGETTEDRARAAAALIEASVAWSDARWRETWERASDHAYARFACSDVAEGWVSEWRRAFGDDLRQAV